MTVLRCKRSEIVHLGLYVCLEYDYKKLGEAKQRSMKLVRVSHLQRFKGMWSEVKSHSSLWLNLVLRA